MALPVDKQSPYPMVPMDVAWATIQAICDLRTPALDTLSVTDINILGCCASEEILSPTDVPMHATSRLDGYAIHASTHSDGKVYEVVAAHRADTFIPSITLAGSETAWVTTGASLPQGADAVIGVERSTSADTLSTQQSQRVVLHGPVASGDGVRPPGSDLRSGQTLLSRGETITPSHVATLLSARIERVVVIRKPMVAIASTGNELAASGGDKLLDSNRPMLQMLLRDRVSSIVDFGIVPDVEADVRALFERGAAADIDVLITTGGVSMGDVDFVKPTLASLGTVHFGRVCMKPGKPAMFGSIRRPAPRQDLLVFALPGNPVSAWVCQHVFVRPALQAQAGQPFSCCVPPMTKVKLLDSVKLDPERPEFHRALVWADPSGSLVGRSTGAQASSRISSTLQANALLWLPASSSTLPAGSLCDAYLVDALLHPDGIPSSLRDPSTVGVATSMCGCGAAHSHSHVPSHAPSGEHPSSHHQLKDVMPTGKLGVRVGILTVSDSCFKKAAVDSSGPALLQRLREHDKLHLLSAATAIVPDEADVIRSAVREWTSRGDDSMHLILVSGGTGMSARDVTPEALRHLISKPCPGLVHAMLEVGRTKTPLAALSRYEAGIVTSPAAPGGTLLIECPGSVKAVQECMDALQPLLFHALNVLRSSQ